MVLCRSKAPLINLYVKLLRKNVNCYIKGQDIGQNIIKELEKIKQDDLARDLDRDGVFVRLFDNLFTERNKLMQTRGLDYEDATLSSYIMEKYDAINALMILSERYDSRKIQWVFVFQRYIRPKDLNQKMSISYVIHQCPQNSQYTIGKNNRKKISCMLHTPGRKIRWVLYPKKK